MINFVVTKKQIRPAMKDTKIYSIITGSCPVCHSHSMYVRRNPYILTETLKMHERCPHCDTKFKIEPSFFYGAMYVSYGVGTAIAIAAFIVSYFILNLSRLTTFFIIVATMVIMLPIILRLSRNIWINFFFKYDKGKV